MRGILSTLSLILSILGLSNIISLANSGVIVEMLTFNTAGAAFILLFNLYSALALICAIFGKRDRYRILLLAGSVILIAANLTLTLVGIYGFQQP
ncbi:hypothetical protein JMA_02890 [Jeotgalibacillus malaysiensis]|uniref:Uncharacterized protein n=1 Tax=Jeotgalibacillus malaysiensis TaxID=1508404 RepID=A0A0B5AHQ3_9BACL|nr:hypothetical protein [Jeotgalibacillus malaysiensis]AJD89606.1 hypothetical protein JMA_02890 [Jeotgalibacillus malaysiensis]